MMKTNLTPSPRLIGQWCCCCFKDFLYNKATLILMIFMLPLVGMAQEKFEFESPEYMKAKEANHQAWLQQQSDNQSVLSKKALVKKELSQADEEYQILLKENGIDEKKYFDNGFTKEDIISQINNVKSVNPNVGLFARQGDAFCATAEPISCGDGPLQGSTAGYAINDWIDCNSNFYTSGVWYKVEGNGAPNTATITTASFNAEITVYSSTNGDCSTLQCYGTNNSSGSVNFFAAFGDTYYILVAGEFFSSGAYTIELTSSGDCSVEDGLSPETGFSIGCGDVISGDTTGFPSDNTQGTCGTTSNTTPVNWYQFTAEAGTPEEILIRTCGFDTKVQVFTGDPSNLECVDGNDDDSFPECTAFNESQVTFTAYLNQTYYIKVFGFSGSGAYDIDMICDGNAVTDPPSAPANDICIDATQVFCGDSLADQTTVAAGVENTATCGFSIGADVWYYVEGNGDEIVASIIPDGGTAEVEVYESFGQCSDFTLGNCIANDTFTSSGSTLNLGFQTDTANFYYIRVAISTPTGTPFDFSLDIICPTPPANDECSGAQTIACDDQINGNLLGASASSIPSCNPSSGGVGVWYHFVGTGNPVTFDTFGSSFDTRLYVYSGACGVFNCEGYNDDTGGVQSEVSLSTTTLGEDYYIYMSGFSSSTSVGSFVLNVTCPPDPCENAELISCSDGVVFGSNSGADGSPIDQPDCLNSSNTPGKMYELVGEGNFVDINTCGSLYDTNLNIYTGNCGALQCVTGNDDWDDSSAECGASFRSRVGFFANAGQSYYIWVNGYNGASGDFQLNITCGDPEPNDLCDGAVPLSCGASVEGSTNLASDRDAPGEDCSGQGDNYEQGVWYTLTGTGGEVDITLCDTDFDPKLLVFTGECGALECYAGNTDGSGCGVFNNSALTMPTVFGELYYIYVTGDVTSSLSGTRTGDFTINVECACAPQNGPQECVTLYEGYAPAETATLTAVLDYAADGVITYAWSTGATTQSIDVNVSGGSGNYTVDMTDSDGCTTTKTFFVYVADVDCDRNNNADKVVLCHNGQTICVSDSAVQSHLDHGDILGECGGDTCTDIPPSCSDITAPADGSVDVSISQSITWSASTFGLIDGYLVTIGTTSGGNDVVDAEDVGNVLSYDIELEYLTTYYVSVVPYSDNAGSPISGCTEISFTTEEDPLPNDDFDGAVDLTVNADGSPCAVTYEADHTDATDSNATFSCDGAGTNLDSWYTFTAPASGIVDLTITNGTQSATPEYALFDSFGGTELDCDQSSAAQFSGLTPGNSYVLAIWYDDFNIEGTFTICLNEFVIPPAVEVVCGTTLSESYCYVANDNQFWSYTSSDGGALTLEFNSGYIESDTWDNLKVYEGLDSSGPILFENGSSTINDLGGTVVTALSGEIYMTLDSDGFVQCSSNPGSRTMNWDVYCGEPVVEPCVNDMIIVVGGGSFQSEVGWTLRNSSNAIVATGGAPYNQAITLPNGSYTMEMTDSWGDGWNGNTYTIEDINGVLVATGGLSSGSFGTETFDVACGTSRPGAVIKDSVSNEVIGWTMSPNPTKGNVNLDLTNFLQENVTIQVVDYTGKLISTRQLDNLQSARYTLELSNSLPQGMYFVQVSTNSQTSAKKLMVVR